MGNEKGKYDNEKAPPPPPPGEPPVPVPADRRGERPSDLPRSNHYATRDKAYLYREYRYLFSICTINERWQKEATRIAQWLLTNREKLLEIQTATNVPWWIVGIINVLEGGTSFNHTILNGDPWNQKTKHFPPGLGPWLSWKDAALFGLHYEAKGWNFNLATSPWHDLGWCFYYLEAWNGFNARMSPQYEQTTPQGASPYIYSGTPFYQKGKKLEAPTRFDPELVSQQLGCMAIAKQLEAMGVKLVG